MRGSFLIKYVDLTKDRFVLTSKPRRCALVLSLLVAAAGCDDPPPASSDLGAPVDLAAPTIDLTPPCAAPKMRCGQACIDPSTDSAHCGGCGVACDTGYACTTGKCALACARGQTACGVECITLSNDPSHCGDCATRCVPGQVCTDGKCASTCAADEKECPRDDAGVRCVDTQMDDRNCGACGFTCATGDACVAGSCVFVCAPGTTACPRPTDGGVGGAGTAPVCVDLQSDNLSCGQCGNACAPGTRCENGRCVVTCANTLCSLTIGIDLDGGTRTVEYCSDLQNDDFNCGACGHACHYDSERCYRGNCHPACASGQFPCNGACTWLQSDNDNCGQCGRACPLGTGCHSGGCFDNCGSGLIWCSQRCVDPSTDRQHCGACGNLCTFGPCTVGVCPSMLVGYSTLDAGTIDLKPNVLSAFPITVSTRASLVRFGYFAKTGGTRVAFGLYSDSGGSPGRLWATGGPVAVAAGAWTEVPITATATLTPSTYWIAAIVDGPTTLLGGGTTVNHAIATYSFGALPFTYPNSPIFSQLGNMDVYVVLQ